MRSMSAGCVMRPITRISLPQRGQMRGSTSPPEAVAALEALLPRALDPLVERLEKAVDRCLPGIPGSVDPASDLHAQPEAGGRVAGMKGGDPSKSDLPTTGQV